MRQPTSKLSPQSGADVPDRLAVPARFRTREVRIGDLVIGGDRPVLIQSMTISDTRDTEAVVREIRTLVEAGCPLVRITAPSIADAENIREIRKRLADDGIRVPMVADIHFTPNAALVAADIVEKVRVNPGNYADRKKFKVFEISDAEYSLELERIRERFLPLVRRLKTNGAALRVGTNHGSLSDRIMNRFGDTPEGMVESALEFVRICRDESYHDIVLSMKSSIPSVMIAAYRLLVQQMTEERMDYPVHLGVTEAGNGLEGRIKSALGIGSLLASGIGDTIRVSLTEDSHHELPACLNILEAVDLDLGRAVARADATRAGAPDRAAPGDAEVGDAAPGDAVVGEADSPRETLRVETDQWRTLPARSDQPRRVTSAWTLRALRVGGDAPPVVELRVPWDVLATGRVPASLVGAVARAGGELGAELVSVHVPSGVSASGVRVVLAARSRWPGGLGSLPILVELHAGVLAGAGPAAGPVDTRVLDAALEHADAVGLPGETGGAPALAARISGAGRCVRWRMLGPGNPAASIVELDACSRQAGLSPAFLFAPGPGHVARVRAGVAALDHARGGQSALGGPGGDGGAEVPPVFLEAPADGATMPLTVGTALTEGVGDAVCLLVDMASSDAGPDAGPDAGTHAATVAPPWPAGGVEWHVEPDAMAYKVLQAARVRLTRAEFIACPSCGRTQFDLQTTTARIRARTEHLDGVKIAIMGCIVNGPGEMADADFGYVGSGRGRVDLYVGKERVEKNIPEVEAEDRLVALLDTHGAWKEPA